MAGIAGIASENAEAEVEGMLNTIRHRGKESISVFENEGTTLGLVWNESEDVTVKKLLDEGTVGDDNGSGHFALVKPLNGNFKMYRDELGVAPLYHGKDATGNVCFASEVKALQEIAEDISEIPPGHTFDGNSLKSYFKLETGTPLEDNPVQIAVRLRSLLDGAISDCISSEPIGSWLSGGLDSSTICALAVRHVKQLKTFTAGLKGSPDLEFAGEMADFIKSDHHEIIVTPDDMIRVLPDVIYYLESFDALLVRSSITNYLVAKLASEHVSEVFSGEGGDELFAGYDYLKSIPSEHLEAELIKITGNLHNTALQRVDRSASAHGTRAHVVFANPEVVRFALTIPVKYKIFNNQEKWILRKAMKGLLPDSILQRPKAKFWEGAGVGNVLSDYAFTKITDRDFRTERITSNGLNINTKEELFYYRIFKDHFGSDHNLKWMGRTTGSPVE